MPSCSLCGRTQNSKSREKQITFHRYPKCPEIREKCIEFSRSYDEHKSIIVNEKNVVCSAHFVADSLNVYNKSTMLKSTAIPSLIIKRVRYGKLDYPEITTNLHSDEKQKVDDMEDIACSCSSIISNPPKEPEMDRVECLKLSSSNGKIANANDSPVSKSISKSSNIFNNESSTKVNGNIFVEASVVEDNETPRRQFLKRGISVLAHDTNLKSKKIKMLNQTIRCQRKTIVSLKCMISNLEDHNLTRSLPQ